MPKAECFVALLLGENTDGIGLSLVGGYLFSLLYDALLGLPKIQATTIETTYRASMGAAKSIMFGISLVGEITAAIISITTTDIFQTRTRKPAVTIPMRARTYVIAGIWKITPMPNMMIIMKSK